ncbi:MAG: hypothetical protein ACKN9T_06405 [Candidatus Methylumidiphilus sp.]
MPMIPLLLLLLLTLSGCGQDLHFKIRYGDIGGLAVGDPVLLDDRPIGKVAAVEPAQPSGHLVEVAIPRAAAAAATHEASFILTPDPDQAGRRRIEMVLANPGGKRIADGEVVEGSYPSLLGNFPFGELLRGFGDALRDLRGQVEQFRRDFERLPNSPESRQLQEEWRRLADEIAKAQGAAGDSLQKDILPKLEQEMEGLRRRIEEEARKAAPKKGRPLET